jgi:hypothetical protein
MKLATYLLFVSVVVVPAARAQDPAVLENIDEAFRLAGVHSILETLPSHVNDMTAAAVAQFPRDQRRQFEPLIKDVSARFLEPDAFYRQLKSYFVKHYDAAHMATFLALERTPVYRTMHRLEDAVNTPAAQASLRRFEANLKSDPPEAKRVGVLQRLDEFRDTTGLEVRMLVSIVNAMSSALGAEMPPGLEAQSTAFSAKMQPILADNVLHRYLFTYRNTDDADLEDYVGATQQKDVVWFNRSLQAAILAVAAERAAKAGEYIKSKMTPPAN